MITFVILASILTLSHCLPEHPLVVEGEKNGDDYNAKEISEMLKQLMGRAAFGENHVEVEQARLGFSWDNCGSKSDMIQVKSLSVSPDPITIPGVVNVSADAVITEDIAAPSALELVIQKKLFGIFIKIPCVDNLGSCTYENPCTLLKNITCPPVFKQHGINCRCPIQKNEYKLPLTALKLPDIKLPSFVENGDYKIKATLMQGSTVLGCYDIQASLKTKG